MSANAAPLKEAVGVVLAGGRGRRMGQEKAALRIGGEPLAWRVARRVSAALARVVVVGPASLRSLLPDVVVLEDREPGLGPLGGLATVLRTVEAPRVFLVACDMPFVAPPLIRAMVTEAVAAPDAQAVLLRTARGLEPLHGVYDRACLGVVEARLASVDRSLRGVVGCLVVREFSLAAAVPLDPTGLSAFNVNTPEEWARALALAREQ
ncbi:MAG: molybdenum cofactor guanylyltransferase [Ktedonobacterales bacterium]|nr:molybdenum cofactor guanylyltransferase [Ktedonobacterales bacterium]